MRKLISFMHISLDGFVAGPAGEMNWINFDPELFAHIGKRIEQGDTSIYGRITYELMESYWPTAADQPHATAHDKSHAKWYKEVRKLVLSNTLQSNPDNHSLVLGANWVEELKKIKEEEGSEILVFGSPRATHALMEENLIDGYWLFLNPVILGKGMPLFKDLNRQTALILESSKSFACGVCELRYVVDATK